MGPMGSPTCSAKPPKQKLVNCAPPPHPRGLPVAEKTVRVQNRVPFKGVYRGYPVWGP